MTTNHHRFERKPFNFNLDDRTMAIIRSASSGNRSYALRKIVREHGERAEEIEALKARLDIVIKALSEVTVDRDRIRHDGGLDRYLEEE